MKGVNQVLPTKQQAAACPIQRRQSKDQVLLEVKLHAGGDGEAEIWAGAQTTNISTKEPFACSPREESLLTLGNNEEIQVGRVWLFQQTLITLTMLEPRA